MNKLFSHRFCNLFRACLPPILAAVILFVWGFIGDAQTLASVGTGNVESLNPPCVALPSAGTAWDIAIHYVDDTNRQEGAPAPSASRPAQMHPVAIHAERDSEYTHVVVMWSDGSKAEGFVQDDSVFKRYAKTGNIAKVSVQDEDYLCPYFTKGYNGTAWISADLYRGTEKIDNKKCYKFVRPPATASPALNGTAPLPELVAWIGVDNKVPVRIKLGNALYSYSELRALNAPVELPDDILRAVRLAEQQQKSLDFMRQKTR